MKKLIILAFLLAIPACLLAPVSKQDQLIRYIEQASAMLGVDTDKMLIRAYNESSFRNIMHKDHHHISYGALQIQLATARIRHPHITPAQLKNPWTNIYCAIEHYRDLEYKCHCDYRQTTSMYMTGQKNKKYVFFNNVERPRYEYFKHYWERRYKA